VVDTKESRAAIQRDLDRLEEWADKSLMKFNKKGKVLHLGQNNPRQEYVLGATQLESSFAKKDLGILVDAKLTMNLQSALAAMMGKGVVSCITQNISSRQREVILFLY